MKRLTFRCFVMIKDIKFALVVVFWLFAATACKEKELPGEIAGVVTDQATGESIKTAGVELRPIGLKTVTGTDGQYGFIELEPGGYKLYITKTGYADYLSNEIIVKSGQMAQGDVQLEKLPPALRVVNDKSEDVDSLDFGSAADDVMRSFNVFNDGEQTLQWQITKAVDWIRDISKESGELKAGRTQVIIVTIDREKLKSGSNVTTLHITSDDGSKQIKVKAVGEKRSLPVLNTLEATNVKRTSAVFHGELTNVGEPSYTERGFVYGLSSMPTIENTISKLTVAVTGNKAFQATVTDLAESQVYYIRAYAINKVGIAYSSNEVKCYPQKTLPQVETEAITHKSIAEGRATLNATIVDAGAPVYTERGFVYGISHNPMVEDADVVKKTVSGQGTGVYSVNLNNMEMGTVYYVRAYAVNEIGTAYGDEVVMDFNIEKPVVVTKAVGDITATTATLNAEIQSLGDPAYTEAGFIYGTMPNPTIDEEGVIIETVKGTGVGIYKKEIEHLSQGQTYYVRAYLRNENYIVYGDIVYFIAENQKYIILEQYGLMVQLQDVYTERLDWSATNGLCESSQEGGYTDWRLPTVRELDILYGYRLVIGGFVGGALYWASEPCTPSDSPCSGHQLKNFSDSRTYCNCDSDGSGYYCRGRAVRTITE